MSRENSRCAAWKHVDGGYAFVIPYTLLRHEKWKTISPHVNKLILDLGRQYSGFNNGYLSAAWTLMRPQGWKSRETLFLAVNEALHHGLIQETRKGGRNTCNLYALTWWPVHRQEVSGRRGLHVAPTSRPSNAWKTDSKPFEVPDTIKKRRRKRNAPPL